MMRIFTHTLNGAALAASLIVVGTLDSYEVAYAITAAAVAVSVFFDLVDAGTGYP